MALGIFVFVVGVLVAGLGVAVGASYAATYRNKTAVETEHHLPIGRTEFEVWSKRMIEAAAVPGLTEESAKVALCSMLLHLPSTQSMKIDSFFTHALRKAAINETAYQLMQEIENNRKARKASAEVASVLNLVPSGSPEKGSAN